MILAPHFFKKFFKSDEGFFLARKIYIGYPLYTWRKAHMEKLEINVSNPIFDFKLKCIDLLLSLEVYLVFPNKAPFSIGFFIEEKDDVPLDFYGYMRTFEIKNSYTNGPWDEMFHDEIDDQRSQLNKKLSSPYHEAVRNFEEWKNDQNKYQVL